MQGNALSAFWKPCNIDLQNGTNPMKFFIDTADLDEIREANDMGVLDGVTTNPSLMAKVGVTDVNEHYHTICEIVDGSCWLHAWFATGHIEGCWY